MPNLDGIGTLQQSGQPVTSVLRASPLKHLAYATRGLYQRVSRDKRDIRQLHDLFASRRASEDRLRTRAAAHARDLGPWLLLFLCVPAAAYLFRRNWLFLFLACLTLFPAAQSRAAGWDTLFQNRNQRALIAYDGGHYEAAEKLFTDPRWKAASAYRRGDLKSALALYAKLDDVNSVYDRGNVLVELARFKQALAAYDEVLARDPGNRDAAYNKAQVLKLLKALQRRQPPGQSASASGKSGRSPQSRKAGQGRRQKDVSVARPAAKSGRSPQVAKRGHASRASGSTAGSDGQPQTASRSAVATRIPSRRQQDAALYRLRQIPDDPAGLLRRELRYEYRHRAGASPADKAP